MGKKVLIVGGVAGGGSAAARLRRLDDSANIILFERGEYVSYANCGLPYYIGGVIKSKGALVVQTPEAMRATYNIDVRTLHEVISIDRTAKTVRVKKVDTGEEYTESYDTLVLSTGSSPLKPPIPGIDASRIMTLWTVPDTLKIKEFIGENNVRSAAVIGGGFIGLEMAENLRLAGLSVTVVEMLDQVMAPIDFEMAQLLHENMEQNGVALSLGDGVAAFESSSDAVTVVLKSGKKIIADLAILAIGVRPNGELAKAAGLTVNQRGGVVVDDAMKTSDPDIYAVGDVIEIEDFGTKDRAMIPLAGPANKQGRIAADNIAGKEERYGGTQGTSVVRVFDLTAAGTGLNEKALIRLGKIKGKDYEVVYVAQNNHGGYYPGAVPMVLKLTFAPDGSKIFGAQIVGRDGVDKRIDTISVLIRMGGTIHDLKSLELAYAPQFSSAKDPVNMAGFTAENLIRGIAAFAGWDDVGKNSETVLLDIREEAERLAFTIPDTLNIPIGQLREAMQTMQKDKETIVFCAVGVRAYTAARVLMENGFTDVKVYPAGSRFYRSTHYRQFETDMGASLPLADSGHVDTQDLPTASVRIDCSGLSCPGPIMKVFETMKGLEDGKVLEVSASDPGFSRDIIAWSRRTGNTLLSNEKRGNEYVALVKKGKSTTTFATTAVSPASQPANAPITSDGKTIIVFSGDLDKVLASFIIANGAAAMGRPVTMFFTFWGLNALRKADKQAVKKTLIESMFGGMMPRGAGKLKLSNMNMGGMGTAMIKKVMKDKHVDSLEDLIKHAQSAGVRLVACTMSMDLMGIREEELIEGVELGGVGAYLGDAEESNVNLFI